MPLRQAQGKLSRQPAGCRRYVAMRFLTSSADNPATRITFWRLLWPEAMVTEERGTFKSFAKNSTQASLARPSTGGEVRESFSASPSSPVTAFFFARGWTLTANVTPPPASRMAIKGSYPVRTRPRPAASPQSAVFVDAAGCELLRCSPLAHSRTPALSHSR